MVGLLALTVRVRRRWPARALDEYGSPDNFAVLRDLSRVRPPVSPVRVKLPSRVYCLTSRQAIVRPSDRST